MASMPDNARAFDQLMAQQIRDLVAIPDPDALSLLCELLADEIKSWQPSDSLNSRRWRPAIEDHEQNRGGDIPDLLVSAIRDVSVALAAIPPSTLQDIVSTLEAHTDWIFRRLALHLIRMIPDSGSVLARDRLMNRALFDQYDVWHEYYWLLQDNFASLSDEDQATILGWLDTGVHGDGEESRLTLMRLSAIQGALPHAYVELYRELESRIGPIDHPDFLTYVTVQSWFGWRSPRGRDDLRSMSVHELAEYLRTWRPQPERFDSSPEGLGHLVRGLVAEEPQRYVGYVGAFRNLEPTYIRAILAGFRDASEGNRRFDWEDVVTLCHWVVQQSDSPEDAESTSFYRDPGWNWAKGEVADLLCFGLKLDDDRMIPSELRQPVWTALHPLTEHPDPTPVYEERYGGTNMDPSELSLNTTRGKAMHAVIQYALWMYRNTMPADESAASAAARTLASEVRDVLDRHLDPSNDPAVAVRAVYGQWFPQLTLLDAEWARHSVPRIFPHNAEQRSLYAAAWDTYLKFCRSYDEVFDILQDEYRFAIEQIGIMNRERIRANPNEDLAEHLMALYWRGKVVTDDTGGLLDRFFESASDELRGHALEYLGRILMNYEGQIADDINDRLCHLWIRRLNAAEHQGDPSGHTSELTAFGWWFSSGKLGDAWAISQLKRSLTLARHTTPLPSVLDHLAELAVVMPQAVVECLGLIARDPSDRQSFFWMEGAQRVLQAILRGEDQLGRSAARELANRLVARGHLEFIEIARTAVP